MIPTLEEMAAHTECDGRDHGKARVRLPPKPPRRRSETRELVHPIRAMLNAMPGVRLWRNNSGMLKDHRGTPIRYGLGEGSADLVGLVTFERVTPRYTIDAEAGVETFARFFALEVKLPGKKPGASQRMWLQTVRTLGGFAAVVHDLQEASDAVSRCRAGLSE